MNIITGHKGQYQPLIYDKHKEKKKANNPNKYTNTIIATPQT